MTFLTAQESQALIDAPPQDRWEGRRDRALLMFPTRTGRRLSRDAVERRVATHVTTAAQRCASLHDERVHPHVLRHSCAMSLLQAGVDSTVIALWLGHYVGDPRSPRPSGSHNAGSMRVIGRGYYVAITRISTTPTSARPRYIHADMTIKERALALVTPASVAPGRYTPSDDVLAYLDSLG